MVSTELRQGPEATAAAAEEGTDRSHAVNAVGFQSLGGQADVAAVVTERLLAQLHVGERASLPQLLGGG